jgi:cardiolipin synthase (CMP-forming)
VRTLSGVEDGGRRPERTDRILTVPNVISLVRLLLVPLFGYLIVTGQDVAALAVLALAGLSDWADGVLARRLNQTSDLGRILDPAADRLYIAAALVGLAWRELIPWWLVAVLVLREAVVGAVLPALHARGYGPLPVHLVGKGGTAMLMYAFPMLLLSEVPGPIGWVAGVGGWAAALWGVGLYWFAGVLYLRQAREIIRTEPRVAT